MNDLEKAKNIWDIVHFLASSLHVIATNQEITTQYTKDTINAISAAAKLAVKDKDAADFINFLSQATNSGMEFIVPNENRGGKE